MPDDRDFLERIEDTWKNWHGEEWSPEKQRQYFLLHGPAKRAAALDQFDTELRNIEPTLENLRRISEMVELRQTMDDDHHRALKTGR